MVRKTTLGQNRLSEYMHSMCFGMHSCFLIPRDLPRFDKALPPTLQPWQDTLLSTTMSF